MILRNYIHTLTLGALLAPGLVLAQEEGIGATDFINSTSLWVAVVVGIVAGILVLRNARKIGGGVLQKVYNFFGVGMLLVVAGFFVVVIPVWASPFVIMRTHDFLFIIGFGVMAYGAKLILKAAGIR